MLEGGHAINSIQYAQFFYMRSFVMFTLQIPVDVCGVFANDKQAYRIIKYDIELSMPMEVLPASR